MTALHRLVYVSRSRLEGTVQEREAQVMCILAGARERNLGSSLTGALLFNDDCFAQALEGTLDSISRTFERIQHDERHHAVTVLSLTGTQERSFPSWSMAYVGTEVLPAAARARLRLRPLFLSRTSGDGQSVLALLRQAIESGQPGSTRQL